jgi:hypothetical protein
MAHSPTALPQSGREPCGAPLLFLARLPVPTDPLIAGREVSPWQRPGPPVPPT